MYTFVKPQDPRCPSIEYQWMLLIEDIPQLVDFVIGRARRTGFDVLSVLEEWKGGTHATGRFAAFGCEGMRDLIVRKLKEKHGRNPGVVEVTSFFENIDFAPKAACITEGDSILVNENGGFFPARGMRLLETIEQESLRWPDINKVRIYKWPCGRHWYAKVGEFDVVVDGEGKWNTKEAAERAVIKFKKL